MTPTGHILAALDASEAAIGIARAAVGVGTLLRRPVRAVHVREDGTDTAQAAGAGAGLAVEVLEGAVVTTLVGTAHDDSVIVLGSSDRVRLGEPVGHVARALMTRLASPLVVVPPGAAVEPASTTLLVPLDGSPTGARTLKLTEALLGESACTFTAVHVLDDERLPAFADQMQHESDAWRREFRDRHCVGIAPVHLEIRVGSPADQVLRVADDVAAALIVVGWHRHLDHGHARTLRALLARSSRPLLLLPVDAE